MEQIETLRLAIVGCGQIVTHHLDAIGSLPNEKFSVVALCDPSPERRKILHSMVATSLDSAPNHFKTLDELILDTDRIIERIDVIFIAVPHDLHEPIALTALQQTSATVVLEKPLAPTADACNRLVQVSREMMGRLIIAEQSPHWQEVVLARQLIQNGAIGQVVTAAGYYYESMRDNITSGSVDEGGGLGWRGSLARAGGGIAIDGGLHWIRPMRELCGRIERVMGVVRNNLAPELAMEGESLGHALFEMAPEPLTQPEGSGPLIATYSCNMLATAPMAHDACPYFRITGNKGEIIIHGDGLFKANPGAGGLRLYNNEHPLGKEMFPMDRQGGFFLGFSGLWQHVARIISENDTIAAHETVVRAADDVRVVMALYKSSKTGQWESTSCSDWSTERVPKH